jgi:hypothetical protein
MKKYIRAGDLFSKKENILHPIVCVLLFRRIEMAKTRRNDRPFSVQKMFFQKLRPWRKTQSRHNGALNTIIRRLKCSRGSQIFNKEAPISKKLVRSNSAPSFPFLSRTLEQGFNSWPSFEQRCREYAEKREQTKSAEHDQPIGMFCA